MKAALMIVAGATLIFTTNVSAQEMPGGLWEMKMKMDMPGLPPGAGNNTVTQCVKPGERKWSDQRNPGDRGDRKCEQTDMKVEGNKVSWKMACKDGISGEGTVTHNGKDAYKMDMAMNLPGGNMKMQIEGKRLAETCEQK